MYGHGSGIYRNWTSRPVVYVAQSTNLKDWNVISDIPWRSEYGQTSDGPGEPTTARMSDGRLLLIFRADSMTPYWKCTSIDDGNTWTLPEQMLSPSGFGQWSVKP